MEKKKNFLFMLNKIIVIIIILNICCFQNIKQKKMLFETKKQNVALKLHLHFIRNLV